MAKHIYRFLMTLGHPYKKSVMRKEYEEIAEICGVSPNRVYKVAHGKRDNDIETMSIMAELINRGIIKRK